MKKIRLIYWILTGLFLFVMVGSAIPDVLVVDMAVQGFKEMQMPAYLLPFVGVAKILGAIAILVPGYPRVKEWAYAGLIFDLIGAVYSVAASGKSVENWAPMFLFIALGFASYFYYHKLQKAKELDMLNQNLQSSVATSNLQTSFI